MTSNYKEVRISSIELITKSTDVSVVVLRFVGIRCKIKVTIRHRAILFYKGHPDFVSEFLNYNTMGKRFMIETLIEWGMIHVS